MLKQFLKAIQATSGGEPAEIMAYFYKSKHHRRVLVLDYLKEAGCIDAPRYRSLTLHLALDMVDERTRGETVLNRMAKAGVLKIGA